MSDIAYPQDPKNSFRGFKHDENLRVSSTASTRAISPDSAPPLIRTSTDCVYHAFDTNYLLADDAKIKVIAGKAPVYSSSDTSVATVDQTGLVTHVGVGRVKITIDCGTYGKTIKEFSMSERYGEGATAEKFFKLVDGCLVKAVSETIDNAIEGKTVGDIKLFARQNHAAKDYVRNPHCWAAQWNSQLACVSPWNNGLGVRLSGTLITQRHVLQCAHYPSTVGDVIRFVTHDNVVVDRKIIGTKTHPNYVGNPTYFPDLVVLTLDSDVPSSITPASVIRDGHQQYIGDDSITNGKLMPCIAFDQEEHAIIADSKRRTDNFVDCDEPTDPQRHVFYEPIIFGDSSDPILTIIDNVACLLTVTTFADIRGTEVGKYVDDLNTMIQDADMDAGIMPTAYKCTEKDMSAYPIYGVTAPS